MIRSIRNCFYLLFFSFNVDLCDMFINVQSITLIYISLSQREFRRMNTGNEIQRSEPLSSMISLYLQERKMVDLGSSRDCMQIILTCFFGGQGQCNLTLRQILLQATNNQAFELPFTDKPVILSANILVVYIS